MAPFSWAPKFEVQPPKTSFTTLSYPAPNVLLVTMNRPKQLNCINMDGHAELNDIWKWLDAEPSFRVGVVTGNGRAFCAGADLKEWNTQNSSGKPRQMPPSGFGGLSRRSGLKPIIAAVNGLCFGGGCEMVINTDLVVAAQSAQFSLPEVKRGVVPLAGAPPRLIRTVGLQRAMELALTGRSITADQAREWGLVNKVVEDGSAVNEAIELAKEIAHNSPDAVVITRQGVKIGWEAGGVEEGTSKWIETWGPKLQAGENMKEGLRAFVEKRKPKWKPAKL